MGNEHPWGLLMDDFVRRHLIISKALLTKKAKLSHYTKCRDIAKHT